MKHILVVDDFRANVIMIQQALNAKYNISAATSGKLALQLMKGAKPDLVLLDIRMPEMNGLDVLKKMRDMEELKDIPVVFLTGQADKENVTIGYRLGICDVIAKPIIIKTIEERINKVFDNLERDKAAKEEEARQKEIEKEQEAKEAIKEIDSDFSELFDDDFWTDDDWTSLL